MKKRFGKTTMVCKKIKNSRSYRCAPVRKKKTSSKRKTTRSKGTATRKIKGGKKVHLGHRTKRGLAQDQKMKSQETHEKYYRRSKRK